ncbi:YibE/F family protein [Frankia sp. CiP3]|nr:YibE/F family protein [Frankia sp. CiP3]
MPDQPGTQGGIGLVLSVPITTAVAVLVAAYRPHS